MFVCEGVLRAEIRTILSPDISQLVKFAGSDNSQLVDLLGRTFLSLDIAENCLDPQRALQEWARVALTHRRLG